MLRLLIATILSLAAFSALVADAKGVTFADGLTHIVDAANSFPSDSDSSVLDGPGNAPTTVEIVTGGEIGTAVGGRLQVLGSSVVRVSGGSIGGDLRAREDSRTPW